MQSSGEELSPVSSTHPSPSNSMESVSNDETFWASLHSTIVNYIDILLDESKIGVPDGWSTYEILEHLVVNDENLFRFLFREDDYRSFSFPKSVLVWPWILLN